MSLRSNAGDVGHVVYDESTATYRSTHDWDRPGRLSVTIIQTVAAATGKDHESMEPLYSVLDPDAINDLFGTTADDTVRLSFTYEGCSITVDGSGEITVSTDT